MGNPRAGPFPSSDARPDLLSDEMDLFLVRFGPHLAASRLRVSERTLRRRFIREGIQLSDHLKETRRSLAERFLQTDLSFRTVAARLGFRSTQAFAHFMRREFGETATAAKRRLRAVP